MLGHLQEYIHSGIVSFRNRYFAFNTVMLSLNNITPIFINLIQGDAMCADDIAL